MKTPIRLISISLRNFLSYGNDITTVSLEFEQPTLIVGRNLDSTTEGEIDSNGAGKSTIVNALAWCLYDQPISDIPQDSLINYINKKNLEVTVTFEKNGKFYKIIRFRKHKIYGGDGIRIYESDKLDFTDVESDKDKDIAHSSIAASNKQLEAIIDMPFDIFSRIVIYSAGSPSFFKLPATDTKNKANQTDIMEELTGLTDLSKKADLLHENMKFNKKEIESLKRIQEEIDNQKVQYQSKIDAIKNRIDHWDTINETDIKNTQLKIDKLSNIDFDFQKECIIEYKKLEDFVKTLNNEISLLSIEISNLEKTWINSTKWNVDHVAKIDEITFKLKDLKDIDFEHNEKLLLEMDNINTRLNVNRNLIKEHAFQISENHKTMSKIAKELEHLADNKCPYCLQQYKDVSTKITELEKQTGELYTQNSKLESDDKKIEVVIFDDDTNINTIKNTLKFKSMSELTSVKSTLKSLESEYDMYSNQSNPYADVNITELESTISTLKVEINNKNIQKNKLNKKQELLKTEILYSDESDLIYDLHKLQSHKEDLDRLKNNDNPHIETLKDITDMKFDDNNYKKIEILEDTILHQTLLHKLLTKKDSFLRKDLLRKSLVFLNEQLKKYLDKLGLPHKVTFTEEMTASISQFGNVLRFGNLSAGQQARVNIALAFAFRDVLQKRYGKISFCILDECLDTGLSTVGVQKAAKFIKATALQDKLSMFIISHKDEIINMFNNVIEVELENGFSRILSPRDIKNPA